MLHHILKSLNGVSLRAALQHHIAGSKPATVLVLNQLQHLTQSAASCTQVAQCCDLAHLLCNSIWRVKTLLRRNSISPLGLRLPRHWCRTSCPCLQHLAQDAAPHPQEESVTHASYLPELTRAAQWQCDMSETVSLGWMQHDCWP